MDLEDASNKEHTKKLIKTSFDPANGWDLSVNPPGLEGPSKNVLWEILKQIRQGVSFHRIPLPASLLEPKSLLEMYAQCNIYSKLLCKAVKLSNPIERMIGIVRWFLAPWRLRRGKVRKPYNPILGEMFICSFDFEEDGKIEWISEQVCHHPPISGFYMRNKKLKFNFNGTIWTKSEYIFPSAAAIQSKGYAILTLEDTNEQYKITYPTGYVPNFIATNLQFELIGKTIIECVKTGMKAEIDFQKNDKGFFGSGREADHISGIISRNGKISHKISGKWTNTIYIELVRSERAMSDGVRSGSCVKSESRIKFFDDTMAKKISVPLICKPVNQQKWYESRKLWQNVTRALWLNNIKEAAEHKHFNEQRQRKLRAVKEKDDIS